MSSFCPQPDCPQPNNAADANFCMGCGSELILGDRYRCLRLIGRGGFGRTFLAQDEYQPSKPRCAIKQLFPLDRSIQTQSVELFQ
jgi:serine/threonine protein kinase